MRTVMQQQQQQFGNYRLIRLLDSGGFADIYLAEHISLKTLYAVKVLQMQLFDEEQQQHFLQEARLLAQLKHPRIIQVVDFGVENAVPFLVMTYAPNGNLRQLYPAGAHLSPHVVVRYIKQAAEALQHAHKQSLIHRDIKPENFLLDTNNDLLLSDFGIAIVARSSHSQSLQDIVGTAAYMAPEQIRGRPRPASDQYALAVVAYEWICGEPPFKGATYLETAKMHLTAPVPSPREKRPAIAEAVAAVLLRALAKDHHQRFESVQDFAQALEQACFHGVMPRSAPRSQAAEREDAEVSHKRQGEGRRVSRRLVLAMLGGLGVLSAAGGYVGWRVLASQPQVQKIWQPAQLPTANPTLGKTLLTYNVLAQTGIQDFAIDTLAWSPDGEMLLSAGSTPSPANISQVGLLTAWDASSGETFLTNSTYTGPAYNRGQGAAWSPDGKLLAATTSYTIEHASFVTENTLFTGVHILNATSGKRVQFWPVTCHALAWSPDGKTLALAGPYLDPTITPDTPSSIYKSPQIMLVSASTGQTLRSHYVESLYISDAILAWSPDSRYVASYDKEVSVWEATTAQRVSQYQSQGGQSTDLALAWSPDSKYLASAWGSEIHIASALTGKPLLTYKGHVKNVRTLAWSPDGSKVASGGEDTTVQIWNAKDGKLLYTYRAHTGNVLALVWSPDGNTIASGGEDGVVRIWTTK